MIVGSIGEMALQSPASFILYAPQGFGNTTFPECPSAGRVLPGMTRVDTATNFANIFWHARDRGDLCTLTLLAWLSACDGSIAPKEEAFLRRIACAAKGVPIPVDLILELAREATLDDLEIACRYAVNRFSRSQKQQLARLAITLTAQDGTITVGENYALQFLADLLGIAPRPFAKLFQEITHRPYPEPGDPSSVDWWHRRQSGQQAQPAFEPEPEAMPLDNSTMTRARALALLNLTGSPTPDAIHTAFRRLAKQRHPDRFAKLGATAIAAATESFQQLESAYAFLKTA